LADQRVVFLRPTQASPPTSSSLIARDRRSTFGTTNSLCRKVQIEEIGKTTAGNIGISGSNAKRFIIPVPPLPEQRRIVAYLDDLQQKTDSLKALQAETSAELDALMPSILDKAFRGEL
jgi:type I restriction enzyme S subunit